MLAGSDSHSCNEFKRYLDTCFSIKDLGPLKFFLGIEVARGQNGLFLSQRKYALEILHEFGLSGVKPSEFPMEANHKLALAVGNPLVDAGQYHPLIGQLTLGGSPISWKTKK